MEDLFRNWCMSCLHVSIVEYDPHRIRPFLISCTLREGELAPCDQCYDRNAICESARVHPTTIIP